MSPTQLQQLKDELQNEKKIKSMKTDIDKLKEQIEKKKNQYKKYSQAEVGIAPTVSNASYSL